MTRLRSAFLALLLVAAFAFSAARADEPLSAEHRQVLEARREAVRHARATLDRDGLPLRHPTFGILVLPRDLLVKYALLQVLGGELTPEEAAAKLARARGDVDAAGQELTRELLELEAQLGVSAR